MGMDEKEAEIAAQLCLEGALESDKGGCSKADVLLAWSGRQADAELPEFSILDDEVTNAQYQQCVDEGSCEPPNDWRYESQNLNQPAPNLNWFQAKAYCEWLGGRLPTEAEWEKAARGPLHTIYPWGNTWDETRANLEHFDVSTVQDIVPDGNTDISGYQVKNMAGNVREWTASEALPLGMDQHFKNEVLIWEDESVHFPVIVRGGSWNNERSLGMAANRGVDSVLSRRETLGFRCVCPNNQTCKSPWSWIWVRFGN